MEFTMHSGWLIRFAFYLRCHLQKSTKYICWIQSFIPISPLTRFQYVFQHNSCNFHWKCTNIKSEISSNSKDKQISQNKFSYWIVVSPLSLHHCCRQRAKGSDSRPEVASDWPKNLLIVVIAVLKENADGPLSTIRNWRLVECKCHWTWQSSPSVHLYWRGRSDPGN